MTSDDVTCILLAWEAGELSEEQVAGVLDLDRVTLRGNKEERIQRGLTAAASGPAIAGGLNCAARGDEECMAYGACSDAGHCVRKGATAGMTAAEPPHHATKENGDCPSWCKACAAEAAARGVNGNDDKTGEPTA